MNRTARHRSKIANSKAEGLLDRARLFEMNAFKRQHASLRCGAAGCRKATKLAAGCQNAVTRNDQRHRVLGHCLTHIARGLTSRTNCLCQGAIGACLTPTNLPGCSIDLLKERLLVMKVERELRKVRPLAFEIASHRSDYRGDLRRGRSGLCAGQP